MRFPITPLRLLLPLALLHQLGAIAAEPPAKALKYHEALLKRPSNETLFDRFFGAWIDEQNVAELEKFLTDRAQQNGGADLSVLARYQLRRGNEEAALATLGTAITALPQDFSLPMERAKILLRRLKFAEGRKDLETVAAAASMDSALALEAAKLIGKSWLREGNPEQAIKAWDKLLAAHPTDEDLLEDLIESAAAEGETEQAVKYIDKLIAASSDPYKKTLYQLRRGDLLAQAGRHDDAVAAYSATLAAVGEGSWLEREILAQIDKLFRKQDRVGELKEKLAELTVANPGRLLIHRELARIEAAQGETDAAVGRFREVLKRTPGNRELREEFVRLLTDGEKYPEAATELEKLITLAPQDSSLLLQMADLRHREGNKETTLAALEKAHAILGSEDESAGIRISSLMFQYGLGEISEKLLLKLAAAANASEAPSTALAAEYARTNRKPEALAILEKIATSENLETLLRAAGTISALSESATALKVLSAKDQAFGKEPRFLAAISQAALAAGKPEIAVTHAVKLVRLTAPGADLTEALVLALRAIADADKTEEWRTTLEKQETRTLAETCLFASLADSQSDFDAVSKIMANAKEPILIRFHAALLDRRGEFDQAVTVMKSLADTEEGRKASYFKELADLQRRAGLTEEALATVELWKQSAPSDKTAWITGGSILREGGRAEEAVKTARQTVARFGEDSDLAATLAALHEEAGQMQDAEAIYWRLYDESESPSDQARWSVRLAEISMSTGRTEELGEKLRERARGNRRSIGPILAQAELARITQDEDKRRDLLLEAVRLQPKDIDLRLQIANLEEQGGKPERVIAILEEAAPADPTNRVRGALAQAYLRQGQTLKGMRELRAIAGKQANDPRTIEQSAAALAGSGLYEEAIRFLRETLPDGGDWRTRYLLAVMLEHDGREAEAIPLFQALRQASGELTKALPAPANSRNSQDYADQYPESVQEIIRIMVSAQAAYLHRNPDNYGGGYQQGGAKVGPFMLPDSVELVRTFSLVHLAKLGAEGLENSAFIKEIISVETGNQPNFPAILAKYPEQPGLLEIVLLFAGWNEEAAAIEPELLKKLLTQRKDLSPADLFRARLTLATLPNAPETAWDELFSAASALAKTEGKDQENLTQVAYQLLAVISREQVKIPEKNRKALSDFIIGLASKEDLDGGPFKSLGVAIFISIGTTAQWIEAANKEVEAFRKQDSKSNAPARQNPSNYGGNINPFRNGNGEAFFAIPTIETVAPTSLPSGLLSMIRPPGERDSYYGFKAMDPNKLLGEIDSISSPFLRAWIAMRAGDKAAIDKALSATPPEIEAADFNNLRALRALDEKDFSAAYKLLAGQRAALASDRNRITSLNFQLLAIAAEMSPEQRKEISEELGQILIQLRRTIGAQGAPILAAQAERLGLPDLAKRFLPVTAKQAPGISGLGAATFGKSNSRSNSSGNATIEKLKKFAADGKNEAAALEALNLIRKAIQNPQYSSDETREVREVITPPVLAELMKLIAPGDSKSLTKLTEYAEICLEFGKREEALTVLNRLHTERPNDAAIAVKLAFVLPPADQDRATKLLSATATKDGFAEISQKIASNLSADDNGERTFAFFETTATWLENSKPEEFSKANLTWLAYQTKNFIEGDFFDDLGNLSNTDPASYKENKDYPRFVALAKRLALAMLRHPSLAEEGFRLSRHSLGWKLTDAELDEHARAALIADASLTATSDKDRSFFVFRSQNGSQGGSDSLSERSSIVWLVTRLATAKSPDKILPPVFLAKLREINPDCGELTAALARIKDVAELEKLWKSESLTRASGPFAEMLRDGVLTRAASIPGASGFFLKLLQEIKPGSLVEENSRGETSSQPTLILAALKTSAAGDAKELTAICSAISKAFFGEKIQLDDPATTYQAINTLESIFSNTEMDPVLSIPIYQAFFSLGVPLATDEYSLQQAFRSVRASKVADTEKLFAAYGWHEPIETWQPYAAILVKANTANGKLSLTRSEKFLIPDAVGRINTDFSTKELVNFLEKRTPQTFGTLITAASLSKDTERARLTALAFSTNAAQFTTMPPERIAEFSILLPWLSKEALASLPPSFQEKAEGANSARLTQLNERADAFLKNTANNNRRQNNPFDEVEDLIREIAPLDMARAVALFLEAECRFTDNLSRGGRLSSYTSSSLQITERDEVLEELIADTDQALGEPTLALAFHNAIASSPQASRLSFSTRSTNTSVLFKIGYRIFTDAEKGSNAKEQQWMRALKGIQNLPEELRTSGYLAMGTFLTGRTSLQVLRNHASQQEIEALPEQARVMHTAAVGVRNWKTDKPADREATRNALVSIATDSKIPFPTRFQFISMAATLGSPILTDPAIAENFTTLFEEYTKGERSVINGIGIHSAIVARFLPDEDAIKPILARINQAFWENANSPKPGGHSAIPPDFADELLVSAAIVGDVPTTKKLLNIAKKNLSGKTLAIISLIASGNHEIAKDILAPLNCLYTSTPNLPPYGKKFEKRFSEFRTTPGLDPISLLRFEAILMDLAPAATGPDHPLESDTQREKRIIATYLAKPPTDLMLRTEIVSRLIRDSHLAAIALHDEVIAISKLLDLKKSLFDWSTGTGTPSDLVPRYQIAPVEAAILRQAAFLLLLDGDPTGLANLAEVIQAQPPTSDSHDNGTSSAVRDFHKRVCVSAPLWIAEAVHLDKTAAFAAAYDSFAKLTLVNNSRPEFYPYNVFIAATPAEFLAHWDGQGPKYQHLLSQIKDLSNQHSYLKSRSGLAHFSKVAKEHRKWSHESFADTRHDFLVKAFSRKEMTDYYGPSQKWLPDVAANAPLRDDLLKIAEAPPQGIVPTVLTHLLNHRADAEFRAKRFDSGVAAAIAAIDTCPQEGDWKNTRFDLQAGLIERHITAKNASQGRELYDKMITTELNPPQQKRHKELAEKLAKIQP